MEKRDIRHRARARGGSSLRQGGRRVEEGVGGWVEGGGGRRVYEVVVVVSQRTNNHPPRTHICLMGGVGNGFVLFV